MDAVDVLNAVRAFLADDLSHPACLPPHVEERRQVLLENLDLLTFGPCPSPPLPTLPASSSSSSSVSPQCLLLQRHFCRSKRHSMPPAIAFPPSPRLQNLPPGNDSVFVNLASSSASSVYTTPCGLSQWVSLKTAAQPACISATSPLYEEPVRFVQRLSLEQQDSPPGWCPQQAHLSSRSSQFESSTSSISLSHQTATLDDCPPSSSLPACQASVDTTDLGTLILPKKSSVSSRRFTASSCTLSGALYHRYKPRKWCRLGYCLLTPDAHLLGFRSHHAALTSPAVSLFVAGASTVAVYAGRESGMQHVFKVTHAAASAATASAHDGGSRALVFAADCEAEALAWISQINQYAQGATPSQMASFTDHNCCQHRRRSSDVADTLSLADFPRTTSVVSVAPRRKGVLGEQARPHSLFLPPVNTSPTFPNGVEMKQRRQPLPLPPSSASDANQEDSGFSGLISSSSSATDGTNGEPTDQRLSSRSTADSVNSIPHRPNTLATATATASTCGIQLRASSLFSSVRRKVADSLNLPKRRSLILSSRPLIAQSSSPPTALTKGFEWTQLEMIESDGGVGGSGSTRTWRSFQGLMGRKSIQRPQAKTSSMHSTSRNTSADVSLLAGNMFICVPGRLSWTRRWCVLHDSVLEIHTSVSPLQRNGRPSMSAPPPPPTSFLSLPLQPDLCEVAPAFDKRHPLAVRLSAPSVTPIPLLLDAGDTVVMGRWIRAIIAALGHITQPNSFLNAVSATSLTVGGSSCETAPVVSRRLSEIIPPPSPEPIYDEVAALNMASKRWTWTAPAPATWRSVVMAVKPLPTLPSSGPSSPTDSSVHGGGGIYSSVYFDSAVAVEEEEEEEDDDEYENNRDNDRRPTQSLHFKTSHEQLFRSSSSLRVPSTFSVSNFATEDSHLFLLRMQNRCNNAVFSLHRYRSLDWSFSVRPETVSKAIDLPLPLPCSTDDKIASFFHLSSLTPPTTEVSKVTVALARSYSSVASTTANQGNAEVVIPSPRGATMPLGCVTSLRRNPPPIEEDHRHELIGDDVKEALDALDAATSSAYLPECLSLHSAADSVKLVDTPLTRVIQPKRRRQRRRN